jgi:hypothetical protein
VSVAAHRFNNELRYGDGDHPRQWHLTPEYVLECVREDLGGTIGLDPCTFADNPTGANRFYTTEDDGLLQPWTEFSWYPSTFVNPPYGKAREPWVHRCMDNEIFGAPIILLIPASTDTRIFQRACHTAQAVVFTQGRLKFGTRRANRRRHAASHPSALIGWNTELEACVRLGMRMRGL